MGGKSTFIRQVPYSIQFDHLLTCPLEYVFDESNVIMILMRVKFNESYLLNSQWSDESPPSGMVMSTVYLFIHWLLESVSYVYVILIRICILLCTNRWV